MNLEDLKEKLPKTAMITTASFEGSDIVFYTKNKDFFLTAADEVRAIVKEVRKRIEIRPDPSLSVEPEQAKKIIKEIVPKEADIKDILFEPEFGRVIIFASKPGMVIGKAGSTLNEIKKKTLWSPEIQRIPLINSDIINKAREIVHEESPYRKNFLNRIGEKIQLKKGEKGGWVRLSALGGFQEVGRSCLFLQTKESRVLLDCGVNVASGSDAYPYIDAPEFNLETIDAVIISHAHLDHSGFLPYLYEYGYKGPVYTTLPTRDLMTLLQLDYIDIAQREGHTVPYTSKGIKNAIKHSIALNYGEVCDITPDMRLTLENAGHILGSAISHLHIGEGFYNMVYTGDLKFARTQLLEPAFTGFRRVETLITESTYGAPGDILPPRHVAEQNLRDILLKTLSKKGKVLIPSFAVGRAQELMVQLAEEARMGNLNCPVYLDGMIWDATAIHTTYPEFLSRPLQRKIFHQDDNPFKSEIFHKVANANERKQVVEDPEPSVIISTSGMLTGGPIMEYLRCLSDNPKHTLLFVGYQGEGTLGRRIQKGWREVPISPTATDKRNILKINLNVQTIEGFSGHSDKNQLINYVYRMMSKPERILINHGEKSKTINMARIMHKMFRTETQSMNNLDVMRLK